MIWIPIGGISVILLLCKFCGKRGWHKVQQDSKEWESHWCPFCHIGDKYRTR